MATNTITSLQSFVAAKEKANKIRELQDCIAESRTTMDELIELLYQAREPKQYQHLACLIQECAGDVEAMATEWFKALAQPVTTH